jgi:HD superfamily phosphohydrolase
LVILSLYDPQSAKVLFIPQKPRFGKGQQRDDPLFVICDNMIHGVGCWLCRLEQEMAGRKRLRHASGNRGTLPQRNYRDPLHNIISLNESRPEDRLLVQLVDSVEFQRLRRIKQLGLAMFTYQGAEHSRFTHSLGVMHLMTRALDQLGIQREISPEERLVGRTAALLHDLGHGPFSHLIEKIFGLKHEEWTRRIILDPSTEVNRILALYDASLPSKVASVYDHDYSPAFVVQLVSSQLDCDRMDYLLRDSMMTGVKYGVYDLEWVLHALKIDDSGGHIYVESKGLHAIEEYLQARYYMFRQVYFHRTLRSAEALLTSALTRARELASSGDHQVSVHGDVFRKMLLGEPATTAEFLKLDDTDLLFNLKQWCLESDGILSDLAGRFVNRRLLKASDLDMPPDVIPRFVERASDLVSCFGFDPRYYLILDKASDIPYYGYYLPGIPEPDGQIYMETAGPQPLIKEISEISAVVRGMKGYKIERICYPAELMADIGALLAEFLTE